MQKTFTKANINLKELPKIATIEKVHSNQENVNDNANKRMIPSKVRKWFLPFVVGLIAMLSSTQSFSQTGQALNFDGVDDYVAFSSMPQYYASALTIECMNKNHKIGYHPIMCHPF